jgi:hypothetical protein
MEILDFCRQIGVWDLDIKICNLIDDYFLEMSERLNEQKKK